MNSFNSLLSCIGCQKFFNKTNRIPQTLPCQDVICLQCYEVQKQNPDLQQIVCPCDKNHTFNKNQQVYESLFIMRHLDQNMMYPINCRYHSNEQAKIYYVQSIAEQNQEIIKNERQFTQNEIENLIQQNNKYLKVSQPQGKLDQEDPRNQVFDELTDEEISDFEEESKNVCNSQCSLTFSHDESLSDQQDDQQVRIPASLIGQKEKYLQFRKLVDIEIRQLDQNLLSKRINEQGQAKFKLMFKGSRDQFEYYTFHCILTMQLITCYSDPSIITFILTEFGQIFGAFNKQEFHTRESTAPRTVKDEKAFLFSLSRKKIYSQFRFFSQALVMQKPYLLKFGDNDLCIHENCDSQQNSSANLGGTYSYKNGIDEQYLQQEEIRKSYLGGGEKFKVLEIEVYKVTF
ncbi:UNKNOWN [Stylonychia lemnae]|uniref:TLDc domain-containing protein n=1 Tax=Stylonychia lemnae TaxID=5949 RepID=A0A077ZWQ9_STYLE|nr:UNKNOWN [Stylonychia lemnae]|eukprot:CDW73727.1 UNKNOWN [Stylonychia lemnae]